MKSFLTTVLSFLIVSNTWAQFSAGEDQSVCSNTAQLAASNSSGQWTILQGSGFFANANSHNTTIDGLSIGENIFRWTNSNNPNEKDDISIWYQANSNTEINVCSSTAQLNAPKTINGSGEWKVTSGSAVVETPNLYNSKVSNIEGENNVFEWTYQSSSCNSKYTVTINSYNFETYAGEDPLAPTQSTTINLNASAPPYGGTGQWTVIGGAGTFLRPDIYETSVYNMKIGINTYQWEVKWNGCTARDVVVVKRAFRDVNAGADQTICSDSTQLAAQEPQQGNGIWKIIEGSGTIVSPEEYNSVVKDLPVGETKLEWSVSKSGVTVSDIVSVMNIKFVNPVHAGDDITTSENQAILHGTHNESSIANETFYTNWSVKRGQGFITEIDGKTGVTNLEYGENILRWTVYKNHPQIGGCYASDEITITKQK